MVRFRLERIAGTSKNRFFLITDKVAQGNLEIRHMGTKSMWADVNTKPVQGELHRIFRHQMMGVPIEYDDDVERRRTHPSSCPKLKTKECHRQIMIY